MTTTALVSIIIPAYNEENRLPATLRALDTFVLAHPEIPLNATVVDNGSSDNTFETASAFARVHPHVNLNVIREPRRGKGAAVRAGMLQATGDYLFMCDADLSMPMEELLKFLPPQTTDFDVIIGSREGAGAKRYNEPGYRHLMGRVFNFLIKRIAGLDFEDTQCGYKCFSRPAARELFAAQTMDGFAFDIEILYIAVERKMKITQVGINWYHVATNNINPVRDTYRMVREALTVRRNGQSGLYRRAG